VERFTAIVGGDAAERRVVELPSDAKAPAIPEPPT
jgi:hypothetical protein